MKPLVLAVVALGLLAGRAHAGNERVAIASFNVTGQALADEAQAKLKQSLRGGLAAAGFEVVPEADVQRAIITSGVAGCDTVSCLRRIGEMVLAKRVIKATVEVIGNTHVASTLELIDLADGKTIANAKDNCDVCTMKEVNDGLSNAAAALRMQLEPGQPPLPPPAAGGAAGQPDRPSHRTLYIGLAAASGALFVASLTTLAVSGAYHGRANCGSVPAGERCPTRYNGTPGLVLGAIGTPLFGVAAAILAYKAWKSPPSRVALVPSIGAGAVALDLHVRW
ncbi:MAG: hypothetical protein JWN44_2058 [Myxococcales bacterium]|nr:hypothetical protein [Myxococcales bacterium]